MNKCTNCNVIVNDAHIKCPLCQRSVHSEDIPENPWYPSYTYTDTANESKKRRAINVLFFIAIIIGSICFFINIMTGAAYLWSLIVNGSILYGYILIRHAISGTNVGAKIVFQFVGISVLSFILNILTDNGRWSLNYAFPALIVVTVLFLFITIRIKKIYWRQFSGYIFLLTVLGFLPLILYVLGFSNVIWPAVTSALNAFLIIAGLLIFDGKAFINELFHKLNS